MSHPAPREALATNSDAAEGKPTPELMKIRSVKFISSVVSPEQAHPGTLPQIAFAGRSNFGKSSLINTILSRPRHKVARVSATPGKTQSLNFYEINEAFYLVDLPGSGYAHAPKSVRRAWTRLVEGYLRKGPENNLKGVVYLVDSRHPPSAGDHEMVSVLSDLGIPTMIALTKVDKLKARERGTIYKRVADPLDLAEDQVVPCSAKTGEGRDTILEAMTQLLVVDSPVDSPVDSVVDSLVDSVHEASDAASGDDVPAPNASQDQGPGVSEP